MQILYAFMMVPFLVAAGDSHKGPGPLNVVTVGKDHKIGEIAQIKSFTAFYVETKPRDPYIHFVLEIDADTKLNGEPTGLAPIVVLRRAGKAQASIFVRVWKSNEPKADQLIEWYASPDFDENSYSMFQTDAATLILPFSEAESTFVTADKKTSKMTFSELQKKAAAVSRAEK